MLGSLLVLLQTESFLWLGCWGIAGLLLCFDNQMRAFLITTVSLGIGFFFYLTANTFWIGDWSGKELQILFNRLSLMLILIPLFALSLYQHVPFMRYWQRPQWNERIGIPFIWSGYRHAKVSLFLLVSIAGAVLAFMPFIMAKGWEHIQEVWLLALLFSITNVLEEVIWRGTLLSRFSEQWGDKWAVVATSLGFGLQHYSIGFPWWACIVYAIGGLYFGGITVKSNSMIPVILWHATINALMVFGGLL